MLEQLTGARGWPRRPSAGAGPLPCLFVTTRNYMENDQNHLPPKANINLSAYAKKAETLFINLDGLIRRVGIERVGFVTLTFAKRVVKYKDASRRFSATMTTLSNPRAWNLLPCLNARSPGAFTSILVAAFPYDIRAGFDFAACERANAAKRDGDRDGFRRLQAIYCRSANRNLRQFWALVTDGQGHAPRFGRCETLPILSNAAALADTLALTSRVLGRARRVSDKGMRSVRYSLSQRLATCRWSWADGNGLHWRRGCQILSLILAQAHSSSRVILPQLNKFFRIINRISAVFK